MSTSPISDVEVIQNDPYKCAVSSRGEYGILTFHPRAKKPRCIMPCKNSKNCHHCFLWERSEGTHKVGENTRPSLDRKKAEKDFFRAYPEKMKWPPTASTQEKFRDYAKDGYRYSTLKSLVPKFIKNLECIHGEKFDCKDPVKTLWVLSRKVKIYNTEDTRRQGEIKAEVFPQFPTIFQRPMYEADRRLSKKDKDSWDTLCTKLFPEHTQLTPGLFIVSCCCPQKKIYGYKKMVQGESPRIIFDIITTRFEEWYNPNIIYDASCRVKEMGLNREPERFMNILITSDPLHIPNHTTCSQSFQSKRYEQLKPLNKEACEQFNSILRNIQVSLTYMSFEYYMAAMKVFVTFHNNSK